MLLSAQSDGKPDEEGGKLASFCVRAVLTFLGQLARSSGGQLALSLSL
jgi:hypothetical protein